PLLSRTDIVDAGLARDAVCDFSYGRSVSRASVPTTIVADLDHGLCTLLEEAVAQTDSQAFFLAATLLETLQEHFYPEAPVAVLEGAAGGAPTGVHDGVARALCLSDLIPDHHAAAAPDPHVATAEQFDLTEGQCVLPCTADLCDSLCRWVDIRALRGPRHKVSKAWRFQDWVRDGAPGRALAPGERLTLTADGSFSPASGRAGWAVVIGLATPPDIVGQFAGCIYGPVPGVATGQVVNAYVAEVWGLVWAGVIALQFPARRDVLIRADNLAALQGASGEVRPWQAATRNTAMWRADLWIENQAAAARWFPAIMGCGAELRRFLPPGFTLTNCVSAMQGMANKYIASQPGKSEADVQDEGGACLHDLALRLGVWLPAAISSGHATPDHFAALVECEIMFATPRHDKKAVRIDPVAIQAPQNADRIAEILSAVPAVDWSTNVNDHAALVVDHLFDSLAKAFPLQNRRMRASFLSTAAGDLHAEAARWRHALRNRVAALKIARLRCAFRAWTEPAVTFAGLFCGRWLSHLRAVIAVLVDRIRETGKALRQQCRRDKRAHLDGLADEVQASRQGEVHTALKRLLRPRKFRRVGQDPLPRLKKRSGQLCASHSELTEEWRTHFADLEGGQLTSVEDLVGGCLAIQSQGQALDHLCAEEIPDLVQLAQHFRSVNPQKASGPDGLPPAICRRFSCQMAVLFYPILLKTMIYAAEPIGLKGGTLFRIPKPGAPDPAALSSHRAILVQSVLEKVLHKAVRPMTVREWDRTAPALMIGGRKGLSYMIGFFCTRAFLAYTRRRSIPAAILFTDISSAYYSVVRELITGQHSASAPVTEIAANLALTQEDLQQLQHYVAEEPVLTGEGSGELLAALTRELHCSTWFVMNQDSAIVRTQRGTRPGSSLADVLYGLLFTKVLQRRGDFSAEGWKPQVPWNGKRDMQSHDGRRLDVQTVTVQDLVYADDLATCIVEQRASALGGAVRRIAGDSIDALAGHGLRANVGAKKTAALLSPVGPGAREARRQLFSVEGGKLAVLRARGPGVWLTAVAHYRHLGSVLSFDGSLAADVRVRLQSARGNFAEGKRDVFCSPRIDLSRRVQLFRTHVLSALLAGSGAWPMLCKKGWGLLETGLMRMLRQMLRIGRHQEQNWSFLRILDAVELPCLQGLLALERLRFLAQLIRSGPDEAFALLQLAPNFQQAFRQAGQWFREAVRNTGKWRGMLRRAERWHVLANRAEACATTFSQAVEAGFEGLFSVVPEKAGHAQGVAVPGVGVDHLPPLSSPICSSLLQQLRQGQWHSTEEIFQVVIETIEPLPVLQHTVDVWVQELTDAATRDLAVDARLALQADLWCEAVSNAPKAPALSEDFLDPLLAPLPEMQLGLSGQHVRVAGASWPVDCLTTSGEAREFAFTAGLPTVASVASLAISIPAPPISGDSVLDCLSFFEGGVWRARRLDYRAALVTARVNGFGIRNFLQTQWGYKAIGLDFLGVDSLYRTSTDGLPRLAIREWDTMTDGPLGYKIWRWLLLAKPEILLDSLENLLEVFITTFAKHGGRQLDKEALLWHVLLAAALQSVDLLDAVPLLLEKIPREGWQSMKSLEDP
ncbi:unnamed protein product, partial [Symbiodinium necroappetens]